ncbi:MAG TPA: chromosomal replication initiator protein DnaA [Ktedonobacterales bacterium]|nr:chromosomal replication initiator protein DnaA [Ktedonobacterales bacterium]
MNAKQIWQSTLERIQPKISQATFNTWFDGTSAVALEGHLLKVNVRTTFNRAHLETRFHDLICSVLSDLIGSDAEVCFEVGQSEDRPEAASTAALPGPAEEAAQVHVQEVRVQELPLDDVPEPEPLREPRQPALMTVAAARRERFEVAQEGRRLPRRALPYAGPELLPIADAPVAMPLLTRITPVSSGSNDDINPPALHDQRFGEDHPVTTVVESVRPLAAAASSSEEQRVAEQSPDGPRSVAASWPRPIPSRHASSAETSIASGQAPGGEGALNARYTFDTFVVGKSNRFAHAASQGVAEAPGSSYTHNPLLIYGGVGLGKTHLLHAIGHYGIAAGLTVLYTTSDRFTNEIINAIRFHTTEEFRAKYRQIDILLVDDIQFIAGKESTEEEFFHTFNTLHNANKQIVLTSDRPPKAMVTLQDRLRSRFEWGLLADIQLPEYEHRLAILRSKAAFISAADGLHLEIPDAVIEYIAQPECTSIRELEGTLNRVVAFAKLQKRPVTLELAVETIQQLRTDSRKRVLVPSQVLEVVARHYNVTLEALRGPQRDREIAWPRQVSMLMMREETKANLLQIAAELGGRDHSTVIYGANRVTEAIKNNDRVRKELAILREELRILAIQQETFEE